MFLRTWNELDDLFWRPWGDFHRFTELFNPEAGVFPSVPQDNPAPRVNVWANDLALVLTAEAPGLDASTLDISVHDNTLTIKGERKPLELSEKDTYHRRERSYGAFARELELPYAIDADKVQASYKHGILAIHMPRSEADRPHKIQVSAG
jgi:HSP20 family protein